VPVYLVPAGTLTTIDGKTVSASFFAPYDRSQEPYIRIATGDYPQLQRERGRDNALASILCSFAHEVVHYQQWVATGRIQERGVSRKAVTLVDQYAKTANHP
jgi:hypothetical protein